LRVEIFSFFSCPSARREVIHTVAKDSYEIRNEGRE